MALMEEVVVLLLLVLSLWMKKAVRKEEGELIIRCEDAADGNLGDARDDDDDSLGDARDDDDDSEAIPAFMLAPKLFDGSIIGCSVAATKAWRCWYVREDVSGIIVLLLFLWRLRNRSWMP